MPMPFNECDLFFDSESQIPKRNCQKRIHFFDVSSRQSANLTESPLAAVLPELFNQKSPILVRFIAKFARFLAQNRGKFASL